MGLLSLDALFPLDAPIAFALIAASFLTSAITATLGIGGGLLLLVLMGLVMPVATLIPIHGAVQLGSNAGRAWRQRHSIAWPIAWPFAVGALVGAAIGAPIVTELPDAPFRIGLGVFVLLVTWRTIPALAAPGRASIAAGGAATTVLSMFFGATGPLVIGMLGQMIPERLALVSTTAVAMSAQHGLKIVAFGALGFAFSEWAPFVALMILSGYAGTVTGLEALRRIPERWFRAALKALLTLLALNLIVRGLVTL